jgi:pimeloyl-ACP methyl ester carboxylesterase
MVKHNSLNHIIDNYETQVIISDEMRVKQLENKTRKHTISDGRQLAFCEYGDPNGHPVFYAHGGPGSRLEGALFHQAAAKHGLRLIATDRPGMGRSSYQPERKLLDYPADIAMLADQLGIEEFGAMGWSSGGAHTIVCGYKLAKRLTFCFPLCGYTNFVELPGAAQMLNTWMDRISVGLSQKYPRLFQLFFDLMALSVKYFPEAYYKEVARAVSSSDRDIMADPDFKAHFIADQQEAMIQGGKGVTLDAKVHYADWGFRLQEITGKVHVFHGTEDTMVPPAYAQHLAENIPNCELTLLEGRGHLFPVDHQDLIFESARAELD